MFQRVNNCRVTTAYQPILQFNVKFNMVETQKSEIQLQH